MFRFTPHKFFIRYFLTFIAKRWYSLDMQSIRIDRKFAGQLEDSNLVSSLELYVLVHVEEEHESGVEPAG